MIAGPCFFAYGEGTFTFTHHYHFNGLAPNPTQNYWIRLNGYLLNGEGGGLSPEVQALIGQSSQIILAGS